MQEDGEGAAVHPGEGERHHPSSDSPEGNRTPFWLDGETPFDVFKCHKTRNKSFFLHTEWNPGNEILIFFKALEHFEKREYQKAVKIFYFLQESDKIDNEKIEFLRQKLSRLKIIP